MKNDLNNNGLIFVLNNINNKEYTDYKYISQDRVLAFFDLVIIVLYIAL